MSAQRVDTEAARVVRERRAEQAYASFIETARLGGENLRLNPTDVGVHLDAPVDTGSNDEGDFVFTRSACSSETVVLGTVTNARAFLTRDGTFVLTEYGVSISQGLRGQMSQKEVRYIRPGGTVEISGRQVRASINLFPPLEIGQPYILFLSSEGPHFYRSRKGLASPPDVMTIDGDSAVDSATTAGPGGRRSLSDVVRAVKNADCTGGR